jgi:hypothetical protein
MIKKPRRAALYVRVSTDRQAVQNQIEALTAIAEARGWTIVETYQDAGISGAKGRRDRPSLDQMLKDAGRGKFDVAMAWAIDRIGRSLVDLLGTVQTLEACGVDLYLDQQALDTTTPAGKCMFQVSGAFAEFERATIQQRPDWRGQRRPENTSAAQRARSPKGRWGDAGLAAAGQRCRSGSRRSRLGPCPRNLDQGCCARIFQVVENIG